MNILTKPGKISDHVFFVGNQMLCNYLVATEEELILLDAGMTISAILLETQIGKLVSPKRTLKEIWLTHSHYDHIGAVPYLLKLFPKTIVRAHEIAGKVMQNPRAIQLIKQLNEESEKHFLRDEPLPEAARFQPFNIHDFFKDGQVFEFDNSVEITVLFTPGHTRDSVAFYIAPDQILYGGDGLGIPTPTGFIQATFLSDYEAYINSLYTILNMDIEMLALPHAGVIQGGESVRYHLNRSIEEAENLRQRISDYLEEMNGNIDAVTQRITQEDYDRHQIMQPKEAFLINLRAMVALTYKDLFEHKE